MKYDKKVPEKLKTTQQWFGSIIARPMVGDSCIDPMAPSGKTIEQEAWDFITPSATLQPSKRIELYNQQYWWRLLKHLQDLYPLVTRLFGRYDFNHRFAVPFLDKYPPDHWSLNYLGTHFPRWIEENYHEKDKELIFNAALLDWAHNDCFCIPELAKIDLQLNQEELFTQQIMLQKYVHLFELPFDLFHFRIEFLKQEPDYWLDHDFPPLEHGENEKKFYFILYRDFANNIVFEKLSEEEYQTLLFFREGASVQDLCQWLEELPPDSSLVNEASGKLHLWLQRWSGFRWLGAAE